MGEAKKLSRNAAGRLLGKMADCATCHCQCCGHLMALADACLLQGADLLGGDNCCSRQTPTEPWMPSPSQPNPHCTFGCVDYIGTELYGWKSHD